MFKHQTDNGFGGRFCGQTKTDQNYNFNTTQMIVELISEMFDQRRLQRTTMSKKNFFHPQIFALKGFSNDAGFHNKVLWAQTETKIHAGCQSRRKNIKLKLATTPETRTNFAPCCALVSEKHKQ